MKTTRLIGLLGLMLMSLAEAKIGETKDECKARYQEVGRLQRFDNLFTKGGMNTDCTFDSEGKCAVVSYRILFLGSVAEASLGARPRFTAEQTQKLLKLNCGGSEWEKIKGEPGGSDYDGTYLTKDGSRQAKVNFTGITIEAVDYVEKLKTLAKPDAIESVVNEIVK